MVAPNRQSMLASPQKPPRQKQPGKKNSRLCAMPSAGRSGAGLSLAVGLGLLALAGQWAYHQRASLYARIPLARLVLDAACRPLNCRIAPWQNIHAVEIEASEFLKNPDESYALHVALRNSSLHPVAMPALELSLLDADQQLVVRRVIAVDPAVPSPPVLPPRGQWHVDATVDVRLPADLAQRDISGYRLTVFYP